MTTNNLTNYLQALNNPLLTVKEAARLFALPSFEMVIYNVEAGMFEEFTY